MVLACTGAGRVGAMCATELCCGIAGALSRVMRDLRNQEEVFVVRLGADSELVSLSVVDVLRSDCLRPRIREAADLGRRGSNASVKYSCCSA